MKGGAKKRGGLYKDLDDDLTIYEDGLEIEAEDTTLSAEETVMYTPPLPVAKLVVLSGQNAGQEFPIQKSCVKIGRSLDNDIILNDIAVSRKHLLLRQKRDGFIIEDLQSGNGTLLNGRYIRHAAIFHKDEIRLGNTILRFVWEQGKERTKDIEIDKQSVFLSPPPPPRVNLPPPKSEKAPIYEYEFPEEGPKKNMHLRKTRTLEPPLWSKEAPPKLPKSEKLRDVFRILLSTPKRMFVFISCLFFIIFLLGAGIIIRKLRSDSAHQRQETPQTSLEVLYLKGIEAFNQKKWKEARIILKEILQKDPTYKKAYHLFQESHKNQKIKESLAQIRSLISKGEFEKAGKRLDKIKEKGVYEKEILALKSDINEALFKEKLSKAVESFKEKDFKTARENVLAALEINPQDSEAKRLLLKIQEIESKKINKIFEPSKPSLSRRRPSSLTKLERKARERILSLYKKGRFEEARISAQTASQRAQGRMKASLQSLAKMIFTFTKVWREAKKSGLRNPPYTIQKLKTAIHLDKKISKGHFKTSLSNLLVGCFVHYAQNSLKRGKYSLAYQNASQALRYNPYNPKAKAILANLERYAEKLYKQGYSVRKSDPARAKKLWEKVLKIVPPSSIWYQRAEDRLTNI